MTIVKPWGQPEHPQDDVMKTDFQSFGYEGIPTQIFGRQINCVLNQQSELEPVAEQSTSMDEGFIEFLHSIYEQQPHIINSNTISEKFMEGITVMLYDYFKGLKIFAGGLVDHMPSTFLKRFGRVLEVGVSLGKFKETIASNEIKVYTKAAIKDELRRLLRSKDEEETKASAGRLFNMIRMR